MAIEKRKDELDFYKPFEELQRTFDRFFEEFPRIWPLNLAKVEEFVPAVDISETDKSYEFEAEIPGMKKDEITVEVKNSILTIKGEKKSEKKEEKKGYKMIERNYGTFERSFTLPSDADDKNINAKYENGVLTISIPKSPEARVASSKIEIK